MRAVVTRVSSASVAIDGETVGEIGTGFLVLLGIGPEDTQAQAEKLADKICGLRVFADQAGKMNLNLEAVGGALLVVSQFTLYADIKSRRPGFTKAAPRRWPSPCTRPSWTSAGPGGSRWNTASSGRIWRWPPSTTGR